MDFGPFCMAWGAILRSRETQESKIDPKVISWNITRTPQSRVFDGIHSVSARSTERAKGHAGRGDEL